jgi:RNA polymerase sigma-70 factor (ECF subfamily)
VVRNLALSTRLGWTGMLALLALACGRDGGTPKLSVTTTPNPAPAAAEAVGPPHVVAFDPPLGATNVDPARTVLAVTFDRPMDREGWAWVIEDKSTAPDIGESSWDASLRTNSAPVKLEPGKTYVVWINSPQYSYFKDPQGRPATPVRWSFTTRAAAAPTPR